MSTPIVKESSDLKCLLIICEITAILPANADQFPDQINGQNRGVDMILQRVEQPLLSSQLR